jgi:hypothetical protein
MDEKIVLHLCAFPADWPGVEAVARLANHENHEDRKADVFSFRVFVAAGAD